MKILSKIFITLFLALLLIPSVGMLLGFESAAGANEILSPPPRFGLGMLSETADYVADRFALRQEMISIWSWIHEHLLLTSAEEQVILGRGGFLYYSETLDDYTGKALSDAELEQKAHGIFQLYAKPVTIISGSAASGGIKHEMSPLRKRNGIGRSQKDRSLYVL